MKRLVINDIQRIKQAILASPHDLGPGLLNGELGKSIFCLVDYKSSSDNFILEYGVDSLNEAINSFNFFENKALLLSLAEGLPGLRHTLNVFKNFDVIDSTEIENDIDSAILKEVSKTSEVYDLVGYDLLYGLTGIANIYLDIPPSPTRNEIIDTICRRLLDNMVLNRREYVWEEKFGFGVYPYNLGMAHGLLAVICLLSKVIRVYDSSNKYKEVVKGIIRWYLDHENSSNLDSRFPCTVDKNGFSENRMNRLAWCYGDLSSAVAFLQAGLALNEPALVNKALTICNSTFERRTLEYEAQSYENLIFDCGICHGLAGITYSYFYLYNFFKSPLLAEAYKFWHQHLLDRVTNPHEHPCAGCYTMEKIHDNPVQPRPTLTLLEGASGVGLVHHAILDTSTTDMWSSLFMWF
ncbi:MAG: hypothetical protein ING84_01915 [Cytophagales bacterium]|nr:hypothetical protein [Cytophagales bacterium]UXE68389.1 MAG: hypothetical protein KA713_07380 [Chryseotalea sp. WA131a]MCA6366656.1 hypothetical protein [Cytophagales bacterium]MCA6370067.1 hypothetical protein [Cytophagales bacterium]MCA6375248.1 hypothetical protein [Cytophagales bacterium]